MNILDPLCPDNNLGGSINRGSLLRIQRAFAYGAGQLEKLLHSTSTNAHLAERLATFFRNTQKHCRGLRPDAFSSIELCQQVNAASLCDDKASSGSANTEVAAEKVVVEDAQLVSPSCNASQLQSAAGVDNDELYVQLNGISKCINNAYFNKSPQVLADLTTSIDDDTHKAGRTDHLFGKDRCQCSLQDLKTSCKRLERRTSATSSTQRKLSCDHAFYNIPKRKTQSRALISSSMFGVTLSLVPWRLLKIELQEGMVHLGMQPEKRSPYPIIHHKSTCLFRLGPQGCLPQEDHDSHHQITGVTNQTEADILRGDLATYLLNLEAAHCTPISCLQEPLLHASTTKNCSLPIEQESALEGLERPEAVASPISATMDAMPITDLLAEGSAKSRRGTGAFIPNLLTNDNRGLRRVNTSKTRRKEKLKARKKEKALLMEGPVHGSFLNSPINGKENIGGLSDTTINITNSSSWPVEMIQFGSLSPGLLAGSFQDLVSTHGALDSCKANLRARKHALCQQR